MKEKVKHLLGFIKCRWFGVDASNSSGIYIGKGVSLKGRQSIHFGNNINVRPHAAIWCSGNSIMIMDGCEIGERCRISIQNSLIMSEQVLLSPNCYITDCDHEYRNPDIPVKKQGTVQNSNVVTIGEGSYIGINSVIIGNVSIGRHSVIGANSVVTKSIPDYCVAAGNPAKIIRKYDEQTKEWKRI